MDDSRFRIAKTDIIDYFDNLSRKVFMFKELKNILDEKRDFWRLTSSTSVYEFIGSLLDGTKLRKHSIRFPNRAEIRYTWGEVPLYSILLTLRPNAYLSHYSAIFLNGLTQRIPKTVYVNFEQTPKPAPTSQLSQNGIDMAFSGPARSTSNTAEYQGRRVYLINGKFSGQLGVIDSEGPDGEQIRVTNIERTLIDITVRPGYSGGVIEVLNAFRQAADRVSINKLCVYLDQLSFVYPYYQAIGFYLERAGVYDETILSLLRRFEMKYDFYLTNQIRDKAYSKEWKLYFPKGM